MGFDMMVGGCIIHKPSVHTPLVKVIAELKAFALERWWLRAGPVGPAQCGQVDIPLRWG